LQFQAQRGQLRISRRRVPDIGGRTTPDFEEPDVAPGTIVQVYQPGYVLEDRVLRPAMVVVAKGGEKRGGEAAQRKASDDAA